jgi:uncharacterized protein YjhX (UPF0386 family)
MKGKSVFTSKEIENLESLIKLRVAAPSSEQKKIRDKMREIGFYGRDDWGIHDCKIEDLRKLITTKMITVVKG